MDEQIFPWWSKASVSIIERLGVPENTPWAADLLAAQLASDAIIGFAFLVLSSLMIYLIYQKRDENFVRTILLFATLVLLCGVNRLMDVGSLWYAVFAAKIVVKSLIAIVAIICVVAFASVIPQAIALPSQKELEQINDKLEGEIRETRLAKEQLHRSAATLELRVEERTQSLRLAKEKIERDLSEKKRIEKELRKS